MSTVLAKPETAAVAGHSYTAGARYNAASSEPLYNTIIDDAKRAIASGPQNHERKGGGWPSGN